jgi:hypothetical protein
MRIVYWSRASNTRVFILENRDSGFDFVQKHREWVNVETKSSYSKLHKEEVKIGETQTRNLFSLAENSKTG